MEKIVVHRDSEYPECKIPKGCGEEVIICNHELYCGKLLCFKKGGKFSTN